MTSRPAADNGFRPGAGAGAAAAAVDYGFVLDPVSADGPTTR